VQVNILELEAEYVKGKGLLLAFYFISIIFIDLIKLQSNRYISTPGKRFLNEIIMKTKYTTNESIQIKYSIKLLHVHDRIHGNLGPKRWGWGERRDDTKLHPSS